MSTETPLADMKGLLDALQQPAKRDADLILLLRFAVATLELQGQRIDRLDAEVADLTRQLNGLKAMRQQQ